MSQTIVAIFVIALIGTSLSERCLQSELSQNCLCQKTSSFLDIECANTNTSTLQRDFSKISSSGDVIVTLKVRESDLREVEMLPESFENNLKTVEFGNVQLSKDVINNILKSQTNLEHFVLDGADLPTLTTMNIYFPMESSKLKSVRLIKDNIEQIRENVFENLREGLEVLDLNQNALTKIPMAALSFTKLQELDLSGNDIKIVSTSETDLLKKMPKLTELKLDRINCSCEMYRSDFNKYVRSKSFTSVLCRHPAKLESFALNNLKEKDACNNSSGKIISLSLMLITFGFYLNQWNNKVILFY